MTRLLAIALIACSGAPATSPAPTATSNPAAAAIDGLAFGAQITAVADGDLLWIRADLVAVNNGSSTLEISETPVFAAAPMANAELGGDDRFALAGGAVVLRGSIEPDAGAVARLLYAVPLVAGAGTVSWSLPAGAKKIDALVDAPRGTELVGVPETAIRAAKHGDSGKPQESLAMADLAPGAEIRFAVRGLPFVADPNCRALSPATSNPTYPLIPADGRPPPMARDFTATDVAGKQVALRQLRGKVVLVHFWASWCPPCRTELPALAALSSRLGSDVEVLALASESSWPAITAVAPNEGLVVLADPPADGETIGAIAADYGTEKLPETYVIDRHGRLHYYFVNTRDWSLPEADACVRTLL